MTATTAHHLHRTATLWTDLEDALSSPHTSSWPPTSLRHYLAALEHADHLETTGLRALERNPDQLGTRPVPINLAIHDTMRAVHAALLETAAQIAAANQRGPMQPAPPTWPTADRIRRNQLAAQDARDPQRWQFTGQPSSAVRAALWLSARAEGVRWPGRPLTLEQQEHLAAVAAGALRRVEGALDLADLRRELSDAYPCQCGGRFEVYGGNGARPCARCKGCGVIVHEGGVVAA
ncbi:hypothetical protein EAO71_35145 [Streptomyces sp. ms191]|uniref:hypothetical protein n=1 Tax=Streptomyces sp. ms191 TaxID=1827978 RepID=UPI0011CEBD1A|nr:hypothetical protein [Streptomyces sp. ms191]TXS16064.1 hypothetical protein EAO71_35145 [Streptomyces sp. ms191]